MPQAAYNTYIKGLKYLSAPGTSVAVNTVMVIPRAVMILSRHRTGKDALDLKKVFCGILTGIDQRIRTAIM